MLSSVATDSRPAGWIIHPHRRTRRAVGRIFSSEMAPERSADGPKGARGRRFETGLDPAAARANASVAFDRRLLAHDVAGSIAHAQMLAARGVITTADAEAIAAGLR